MTATCDLRFVVAAGTVWYSLSQYEESSSSQVLVVVTDRWKKLYTPKYKTKQHI